jgi:hypothetical protein
MIEKKLYNFDIGLNFGKLDPSIYKCCPDFKSPREQIEAKQFGAIQLKIPDDYNDRIVRLYHPQTLKQNISMDANDVECSPSEIIPEKPMCQLDYTASIIIDENSSEKSLFIKEAIDDKGVFDFTELLTFFTGRRVFVEDFKERYWRDVQYVNIWIDMPNTCTFKYFREGWRNRKNILDNKMGIALLLFNAGITTNILQTYLFHVITAFNIIHDNFPLTLTEKLSFPDLTDSEKSNLKNEITNLLNCTIDDEEIRNSYNKKISATITGGLSGPIKKMREIFMELGVIDNIDGKIEKRIQYVNQIRNRIIHTGEICLPPNGVFDDDLNDETKLHWIPFAGKLLHSLCFMSLCKIMNVTDYKQWDCYKITHDFFTKGIRPTQNLKSIFVKK